MQTSQIKSSAILESFPRRFPPFDLIRLFKTVFAPKKGEKVAILLDFDDPNEIIDLAFLKNPHHSVQKLGYEILYQGLHQGAMKALGIESCDLFAYKSTKGSNLELPKTALDTSGREVEIARSIYPNYNIILCATNYSATAPLTAAAKKYGFRGATMHGLNDIIIHSGLSVDYHEVSEQTEKLRLGMTKAESASIDFELLGKSYHLDIELGKQEAQKSHGICHTPGEVVNLPAGEVYFVPQSAKGSFPIKFDEGTLAIMEVNNGSVNKVSLIKGNQRTIEEYQKILSEDPAAGILGELGFGTQVYPFAHSDIQDEKIFGTFHLATGRNDHLNGTVTLDKFKNWGHATHEDILFSSTKTPEIKVKRVQMMRNGKTEDLIIDYHPSPYLLGL